ncbi:MAG: sigma-70 family RNA polymerase sigma factor [Polyangiaceae bacterium]
MLMRRDDELPLPESASARLCALAETHHHFVWRTLRRLGVIGADTDDATQQVFLVALRKIDRIAAGKERSYLYSVTIRVARAHLRKGRRRREEPIDDLTLSAPGEGPQRAAELAQARRTLERILDELPLDLREVLVLVEIEELPTPAIAEILGLPRGTVASRLRRARHAFRAALAQHTNEVESDPQAGARRATNEEA